MPTVNERLADHFIKAAGITGVSADARGVTQKLAELQNAGGMKELNMAFKAARAAGPSLRYYDFIHAKKIAMLEAIARHT
jgi:hypothetical protein